MFTLAPPAHAQSTQRQNAVERYESAVAAYERGDTDLAYMLFESLWKERPNFDLATSMAAIEAERGQYALAATHLHYARQHLPVTEEAAYGEAIGKALDEALQHIAVAEVNVSPRDAAITIDGKPAQPPYYLAPGYRTIAAHKDGYVSQRERVLAAPRRLITLNFSLETAPNKGAQPKGATDSTEDTKYVPSSPPTETVTRRRDEVLLYGGLTTGVLAVGWGALAWSAHEQEETLRNERQACVNMQPSCDAGRAQSALDAFNNLDLAASVVGISAITAAVATGALWLFWKEEVTVSANVTPNRLQLEWTHVF